MTKSEIYSNLTSRQTKEGFIISIQSIDRAIGILELFKKHEPLDLSEITELLGLSKSTIHTIINTLVENHLLRKNENTKKYQLGYTILELGLKQLAELNIYKQAVLPLKKLSNNIITNRDRLLEELVQTKERGYSIDKKEYVSYMMSISAPIVRGAKPSDSR